MKSFRETRGDSTRGLLLVESIGLDIISRKVQLNYPYKGHVGEASKTLIGLFFIRK